MHLDACAAARKLQEGITAHAVRAAASRLALREIVAGKIGCDPSTLPIARDQDGKPRLLGDYRVEFNMSRSGAEGLVGTVVDQSIGVDIETVRPLEDSSALALLHFTVAEQGTFAQLALSRRVMAFLTAWTRKEACAKAVGGGLKIDLRALDVGHDLAARRVMVPYRGLTIATTVASAISPSGAVYSVATCRQHSEGPQSQPIPRDASF